MTYTPKRLAAWAEAHARVAISDRADMIEAIAVGTNGGKKLHGILKKMRENV
jgi:hypothetical protein